MIDMVIEEIGPGLAKVVLTGRLDMTGSERIDLGFNAIAGSSRGLIVDMSGVDFLASIGIRTLLLGAKTMQRRGGCLVLLSPQAAVVEVLEVCGVLDLLPTVTTQEDAFKLVGM